MKKNKEKREKKEMSDTTRIILFSVIIIIVISLIGVCACVILKEKEETTPNEVKTNVIEIKGYGITLDENDTNLYKEEFEKLKTNLEGKDIDEKAYAESIAKMFVIDLYTISNKLNKYDVGGVEFVLPEAKDNYITNVTDTIYNYVEDNSKGNRNQKLPTVKEVNVEEVKEEKYEIKDEKKEYSSYVYKINIDYINDYGYDLVAEVTVIKKDNFMYVVEKN